MDEIIMVRFCGSHSKKQYAYYTDLELKVGDICVVHTTDYACVRVTDIDPSDEQQGHATKRIIAKVDV